MTKKQCPVFFEGNLIGWAKIPTSARSNTFVILRKVEHEFLTKRVNRSKSVLT